MVPAYSDGSSRSSRGHLGADHSVYQELPADIGDAGAPLAFMQAKGLPLGEETQPLCGEHVSSFSSSRASDSCICFGMVHPDASELDISMLFAAYGEVSKVSRMVISAGGGTQAVGHVLMSDERSAKKAADELHGKFVYPGMSSALVATLQSGMGTPTLNAHSDSSASTGADLPLAHQFGSMSTHASSPVPAFTSSSDLIGQVACPYGAGVAMLPPTPAPPGARGVQPDKHLRDGCPASPLDVATAISEYMNQPHRPQPPAGCAPDAVKLFVGNIPKHCSEAVLCKVFQCYGCIVEVAVTRNRHSAESKGSAFVWYSTCIEAAQAVLALHSRYAFPDARGEHVRLVTVRPAIKTRAARCVTGPGSFGTSRDGTALGHSLSWPQPGLPLPPGSDQIGQFALLGQGSPAQGVAAQRRERRGWPTGNGAKVASPFPAAPRSPGMPVSQLGLAQMGTPLMPRDGHDACNDEHLGMWNRASNPPASQPFARSALAAGNAEHNAEWPVREAGGKSDLDGVHELLSRAIAKLQLSSST